MTCWTSVAGGRKRMAALRALAVSAGLAALLAGEAHGQAASSAATLTGQVIDQQTGEPVRGTMVEVSPAHRRTVTDADGRFEIRLRPGDYLVTVSQIGYAEQRITVSVSPGSAEPIIVSIEPQPLVLEGIQVIADRFESRRHIVPMYSRVMDRARISRSGGQSLANVVRSSGNVTPHACTGAAGGLSRFARATAAAGTGGAQDCVYSRGRVVAPTVYIDDNVALGGMAALEMVTPVEVHHVEVYGRGTMIRVYTVGYVESVASGRQGLRALSW